MTLTDIHGRRGNSGPDLPKVRLPIEYWTVAMDGQESCGACDRTLALLNDAVTAIHPLAAQLGITLHVVPRQITTWPEALEESIVASPTIRAQKLEVRPTHPDGSEVLIWHWRGTTVAALPLEALLDFLMRAVADRSRHLSAYLAEGGPAPYVRRFLHTISADQPPAIASCGPDTSCGPDSRG